MKTISPYTAAAILILSRLFSYGLYIPADGEYSTVTALGSVLLTIIRLILLLPVMLVIKRRSADTKAYGLGKASSLILLILSAAALLSAGKSFGTLSSTVYPDRFSSLGIPLLWIAACAYVASMDTGGIARSASFMVFAFIGVIILTFVGLRHNMLSDRVFIYSDDLPKELTGIVVRLCKGLFDIPILYGLLPYIKKGHDKTVLIYLITDVLITVLTFFMYAAMLGGFKSPTGYSVFTLFSCTDGIIIDRADGIYIAIESASGIITCAALLVIIKDCVKKYLNSVSDIAVITAAAAASAVFTLSIPKNHTGSKVYALLAAVSAVLLALITIIKTVASVRKQERGAAA